MGETDLVGAGRVRCAAGVGDGEGPARGRVPDGEGVGDGACWGRQTDVNGESGGRGWEAPLSPDPQLHPSTWPLCTEVVAAPAARPDPAPVPAPPPVPPKLRVLPKALALGRAHPCQHAHRRPIRAIAHSVLIVGQLDQPQPRNRRPVEGNAVPKDTTACAHHERSVRRTRSAHGRGRRADRQEDRHQRGEGNPRAQPHQTGIVISSPRGGIGLMTGTGRTGRGLFNNPRIAPTVAPTSGPVRLSPWFGAFVQVNANANGKCLPHPSWYCSCLRARIA